MTLKDFEEGYLFFTTTQGLVKRTKVADFKNIRVNGIRAINQRENDFLHSVKLTDGNRDIIIGASNGKAIRFKESDVRSMGRTATGVRGIDLTKGELVIGVTSVTEDRNQILAITKLGYGKRTEVDEYRCQNRGGKGVKTINITDKNGYLAKLVSVDGNEDLLVVSDKGIIIRTPINQISITKRATQGVKIINLVDEHTVSTIALVDYQPEDEEDVIINSEVDAPEAESTIKAVEEVVEEKTEEEKKVEDLLNDSY
ncbi:MAG: hypothetical protein KAH13_03760 [Tenericutes bacterium]|nr:hypothetical protein [Mycoplasmatota bacterium]